ncbi:hypothetical protein PR048_008058 [Dryococelus australis]|uniref:Uncharacterized protein n=1 Tax=Dryococelus australis TaxID=614101 RepID=A0ABQ9HW10_9NEOP|nr:hypothetical protein PR048_008058 [Dryococelus australis]
MNDVVFRIFREGSRAKLKAVHIDRLALCEATYSPDSSRTRQQNGVAYQQHVGTTFAQTTSGNLTYQPAAQPIANLPQHAVTNHDRRPVSRAWRGQSANGCAHIKGTATPFRLCIICSVLVHDVSRRINNFHGCADKDRLLSLLHTVTSAVCSLAVAPHGIRKVFPCKSDIGSEESSVILILADLSWRSRLVYRRSGAREVLGSNPSRVATVAERLAPSPFTKANRVQSPAGSPYFRKWESCRTMPLVRGFSRGSPASPPASLPPMRTGFNPRPGHSGIFTPGNRAGRCRWSPGFLGDLPLPLLIDFSAVPFSPQSPSSVIKTSMGRCDVVVKLPASHLGEPCSIPGGVTHGFSACGNHAGGRWVFSGVFRCSICDAPHRVFLYGYTELRWPISFQEFEEVGDVYLSAAANGTTGYAGLFIRQVESILPPNDNANIAHPYTCCTANIGMVSVVTTQGWELSYAFDCFVGDGRNTTMNSLIACCERFPVGWSTRLQANEISSFHWRTALRHVADQ